jgi:CDP-glucose 4,6-dehydratase
MTPSFWAKRNVLITGHTGFKGAWLALWLQELGAQVCGFALEPPTSPSLFEGANVAQGMTSMLGDVRDLSHVERVFRTHQPEVVFHLAAQPLVRQSYRTPVETFATNVLGTTHVLEAVRRTPSVGAVVVVTTDKCYENVGLRRGYCEEDPLGGHDPYSASKACAELAASAYYRSFLADRSIGVATARAGNVVGGGDWAADRILPDAVRSIQKKSVLRVRSPSAIRPWQHVLEPLAGYLLLAERLFEEPARFSGPWNFGPDEASCVTVAELLDVFFENWGAGRWSLASHARQHHEAAILRLDASKARAELGWRPQFELSQAIELTAHWYREALATNQGDKLRALTSEQIEWYQHSCLGAVGSQRRLAA